MENDGYCSYCQTTIVCACWISAQTSAPCQRMLELLVLYLVSAAQQ